MCGSVDGAPEADGPSPVGGRRPCDSTVVVTGGDTSVERSIVHGGQPAQCGRICGQYGEFVVRACLGDTLVIGAVGSHTQEHRVRSGDTCAELRVLNVEVGALSHCSDA